MVGLVVALETLADDERAALCHRFIFNLSSAVANSAPLAIRRLIVEAVYQQLLRLTEKAPQHVDWQQVLAIREALVRQDSSNERWQQDLAVSNYNIATLFRQLDDDAKAKPYWEHCYRLLSDLSKSGTHLDPQLVELLARLRADRGT